MLNFFCIVLFFLSLNADVDVYDSCNVLDTYTSAACYNQASRMYKKTLKLSIPREKKRKQIKPVLGI